MPETTTQNGYLPDDFKLIEETQEDFTSTLLITLNAFYG